MFILSNLIFSLAKVVDLLLAVLYWVILARAVISWVNPDPLNPIVQLLHNITEPILEPIRRILPRTGIDFSPVVAFLGIIFLQHFLVSTLFDIGYRLKVIVR